MIMQRYQKWQKKQMSQYTLPKMKMGESDSTMSIDAYEKREQLLQLRSRVLQAERERLEGAQTLSISQARQQLRERITEDK
jgi:hypothetical protein